MASANPALWDRHRTAYEIYTSDAVLAELSNAPAEGAEPRLRLMDGIRVLSPSGDVQRIAAYSMEHRLMPRSAGLDALHVAFASVHGIDFLLTWNCKHIANANKAEHLAVLNKRLSLPVPIMATPYTPVPEERS